MDHVLAAQKQNLEWSFLSWELAGQFNVPQSLASGGGHLWNDKREKLKQTAKLTQNTTTNSVQFGIMKNQIKNQITSHDNPILDKLPHLTFRKAKDACLPYQLTNSRNSTIYGAVIKEETDACPPLNTHIEEKPKWWCLDTNNRVTWTIFQNLPNHVYTDFGKKTESPYHSRSLLLFFSQGFFFLLTLQQAAHEQKPQPPRGEVLLENRPKYPESAAWSYFEREWQWVKKQITGTKLELFDLFENIFPFPNGVRFKMFQAPFLFYRQFFGLFFQVALGNADWLCRVSHLAQGASCGLVEGFTTSLFFLLVMERPVEEMQTGWF